MPVSYVCKSVKIWHSILRIADAFDEDHLRLIVDRFFVLGGVIAVDKVNLYVHLFFQAFEKMESPPMDVF